MSCGCAVVSFYGQWNYYVQHILEIIGCCLNVAFPNTD